MGVTRWGGAGVMLGLMAGLACRAFSSPPTTEFLVTPTELVFSARSGGLHPALQFLTLIDGTTAQWTATADVPWIGLGRVNGTLPDFLDVGVGTELPVGTYAGHVVLSRPSTGDSYTVPVTLTLTSVTPLGGRWAGSGSGVAITLALTDSVGQVTGSGSLGPPTRAVQVSGSYAYPAVSLHLVAGIDTTNLTGSFVNDNTIAATLRHGGSPDVTINLYRQ